MPSVWQLLTSEPDHPFSLLAGSPDHGDRPATRVRAIDALNELAAVPAGALVVVPRHCLANIANYELDVAVRVAADRGVAGLLLAGLSRLPATVVRVADRTGLVVAGVSDNESLVDLIRRLDRLVVHGQSAMLERAEAVVEWLRTADVPDDHLLVLQGAASRLAADIRLTWLSRPAGAAEPVRVGGRPVGWIHGSDASDDVAVSLALPAIATAVGSIYERTVVGEEAVSDIVAGLIDADAVGRQAVAADRAVALGLNLNARHVVACVSAESAERSPGEGLLGRRHRRALAAVVLREHLGLKADSWLITRTKGDLALLWTVDTRSEPDITVAAEVADEVLAAFRHEYPMSRFFGGVGSAGFGVDGLRMSAAEALAAAHSARAQGIHGQVIRLHGSRLEQVLGELVTSSVSGRIIDGVLAPLNALPERSRFAMIETLSTYLDLQGSKVRAARTLHMHPNAIGYRVTKATKLLEANLADADTRFILQLACRVWLLTHEENRGSGA